jgi:WD40 repeat protein
VTEGPRALATAPDKTLAIESPSLAQESLLDLPVIPRERYAIDGEYARGGLGRVLEAHDVRLDRPVAIKELLEPFALSQLRFVREALVTARLQHPSIVPIYEAGRWPTGEPVYAMKMVTGRSLADIIAERPTLDERLALIPNVVAVADALAYAHSQGVIHRDIKPANVLVGRFGETVVIDWGIAKDIEAEEEVSLSDVVARDVTSLPLTQAGSILGTPAYMAPEQASGGRVDPRTDVYAIGALLYHVLVGRPPYDGDEALAQVLAGPPAPPEQLQKGVPRELLAVVRKSMARSPEDRYPSALELAEDLRRFQTGQLVSAHDYSWPLLLWRWLKRHRLQAVIAALVLAGIATSYRRAVSDRHRAEQERGAAEARTNELILLQARNALASDPTATLAWLKRYPAGGADWSEVHNLAVEARELGVARHVFVRDQLLAGRGDFSPDGRHFVGGGEGRAVHVWDVATGRTLARLPYGVEVSAARFLPDGQRIVISDWRQGTIKRWDWRTGIVHTITDTEGKGNAIDLSPDGRWLALAGEDGLVHLWRLDSGIGRGLRGHQGDVAAVSFSPSTGKLASAGIDGTAWLWDLETGQGELLRRGRPGITTVRCSPDGRWLAVGGADGQLWLWDAKARTGRTLWTDEQPVFAIAFSPDVRQLAVSYRDGTIRLWRLGEDQPRTLHGHQGEVQALTFSDDGRELASAGRDETVRRFHLDTGTVTVLRGHQALVVQVVYARGSHLLASAAHDRTARLWEPDLEQGRILTGHTDDLQAVAFAPDGRRLATASRDFTLRLWSRDGEPGPVLRGHNGLVWKVAFAPDGRRLVSGGFDHEVRVWDLSGAAGRLLGTHEGAIREMAFLGMAQELVSIGNDHTVRRWSLDAGPGEVLSRQVADPTALAVSPDGRLVAWVEREDTVVLHDRQTRRRRELHVGGSPWYRLAFSTDARHLAVADGQGATQLWDLETGARKMVHQHFGRLYVLAFSPDGRWLASAGEDKLVWLGPSDGGPGRVLMGHEDVVRRLAFSPDGDRLASASWDGTVRLWGTASGALERIFRHRDSVFGLDFAPDGRLVASASTDDTAGLWPVDRTETLPRAPDALLRWMQGVTSVTLDGANRLRSDR